MDFIVEERCNPNNSDLTTIARSFRNLSDIEKSRINAQAPADKWNSLIKLNS